MPRPAGYTGIVADTRMHEPPPFVPPPAPPASPGPPPTPTPAPRAAWKPIAVVGGVILLFAVVWIAAFVGGVVMHQEKARNSTYAAVMAEYRKDAAAFAQRCLLKIMEGTKEAPATTDMTVTPPAHVTDLGPALRIVTLARGPLRHDGEPVQEAELEFREYFHAGGVEQFSTECAIAACDARAALLAQAERLTLASLGSAEAARVLPEGGECTAVGDTEAERTRWHACEYPSGVSITVRRLDDAGARGRAEGLLPSGS